MQTIEEKIKQLKHLGLKSSGLSQSVGIVLDILGVSLSHCPQVTSDF